MAHLHHPAEVAVIFKGKWQVEEKCVRHPLIFFVNQKTPIDVHVCVRA